ncbi:MAG: thiosulfate/3-mercaptopyruvate sulfurtransferase, partial [Gemmatimonadales bacterium]|nr:thiosulfate/3-mercaptopyruvate sulfurtransferase [Gemmatimonadales bacterium]
MVSTEWLAARLGSAGIRVVDASWYLPGSGRDAATEYAAGHIPGAVFFDIDASSDPGTSLPHMLPAAERFAERMAALGLSDSDHIVVYDGSGQNLSAPRVWWMFRTFGHDRVSVLDGGIAKWRTENRALEPGVKSRPPGHFTARLDPTAVRDLGSVRANIDRPLEQLV